MEPSSDFSDEHIWMSKQWGWTPKPDPSQLKDESKICWADLYHDVLISRDRKITKHPKIAG